MRLTDFVINLFTRVTPLGKEELASLKTGIANQYQGVLENLEDKQVKKQIIMEKIKDVTEKLEKLDEHTPEYQEKLKSYQDFKFELEKVKPSIIERIIKFFENPLVRVAMTALFSIVSYWFMKKLTSNEKDEPEDDSPQEDEHNNRMNYPNYPPPPHPNYYYYPPYHQHNGNR